MVTGIIGRKVGMTQLFHARRHGPPGTVIKAGPCVVVQTKTAQRMATRRSSSGSSRSGRRVRQATAGHYKKAGVPPTRVRREVKVAKGAEAPGRAPRCWRRYFRRRSRRRDRGESGEGLPGRHQAPSLRGRRRDARIDVPPRARIDRRFVLSRRGSSRACEGPGAWVRTE